MSFSDFSSVDWFRIEFFKDLFCPLAYLEVLLKRSSRTSNCTNICFWSKLSLVTKSDYNVLAVRVLYCFFVLPVNPYGSTLNCQNVHLWCMLLFSFLFAPLKLFMCVLLYVWSSGFNRSWNIYSENCQNQTLTQLNKTRHNKNLELGLIDHWKKLDVLKTLQTFYITYLT